MCYAVFYKSTRSMRRNCAESIQLYNFYTFPFEWPYKRDIYFKRDNLKILYKIFSFIENEKKQKIFLFGNSILFHFQCSRNSLKILFQNQRKERKELCTLMDSLNGKKARYLFSIHLKKKKKWNFYNKIFLFWVEWSLHGN